MILGRLVFQNSFTLAKDRYGHRFCNIRRMDTGEMFFFNEANANPSSKLHQNLAYYFSKYYGNEPFVVFDIKPRRDIRHIDSAVSVRLFWELPNEEKREYVNTAFHCSTDKERFFEKNAEVFLGRDVNKYIQHADCKCVMYLLRERTDRSTFKKDTVLTAIIDHLEQHEDIQWKNEWLYYFTEETDIEIAKRIIQLAIARQWQFKKIRHPAIRFFPQYRDLMSYEQYEMLLKQVNWNSKEGDDYNVSLALLEDLHADVYPNLAYDICNSLQQNTPETIVFWWPKLTYSTRVRFLISLSFQLKTAEKQIKTISERIETYEKSAEGLESKLILAILSLLNVYYKGTQYEKEKQFAEAHEILMVYIKEIFTVWEEPTHALNTLLDRCLRYEYEKINTKKMEYYCSAYALGRGAYRKVICPREIRGKSSPCVYTSEHPLVNQNSIYNRAVDPVNARFCRFLLNLNFNPRFLPMIDSKEHCLAEYPYRISGFINRLIRMKEHMVCRNCGQTLICDFKEKKQKDTRISETRFSCSNTDPRCDKKIYFNHCCGCNRIIDSRDGMKRDGEVPGQSWEKPGLYLCVYCGTTKQIKESGKFYCPNCLSTNVKIRYNESIVCFDCGHDGEIAYVQRQAYWHDLYEKSRAFKFAKSNVDENERIYESFQDAFR